MAITLTGYTTFPSIIDNLDTNTREVLGETADVVVSTVQANAPVRTGELRDSYDWLWLSFLQLAIGSDLPYSVPVEYGSMNRPAQPHLTPAMDTGADFLLKTLPTVLTRRVVRTPLAFR